MTANFTGLSPGSTIGVMAPSSYVEKVDIDRAAARLTAKGYQLFIHPQTYERDGQSAGTLLQKTLAFQGLWQRNDIGAIWFAGGGNHSLDLLGSLNFKRLKAAPGKPVIGFSDTTTLLNALACHTGHATLHGPVFKQLGDLDEFLLTACLNALQGSPSPLALNTAQCLRPPQNNTPITGHLIGGNLSLFQYTQALLPVRFTDGAILCLEECNEELSHIDRIFSYFKHIGLLERCRAIVLGQFTDIKDTGRPFEKTLTDSILYHTDTTKTPVFKDLPFGHTRNNFPFAIGLTTDLKTD